MGFFSIVRELTKNSLLNRKVKRLYNFLALTLLMNFLSVLVDIFVGRLFLKMLFWPFGYRG